MVSILEFADIIKRKYNVYVDNRKVTFNPAVPQLCMFVHYAN